MISADAVFLPTVFLLWLGNRVTRGRQRLFSRTAGRIRLPGQRREAPEGEEAVRGGAGGGHTLVG